MLTDFNAEKTQLVSFDWPYNTGVIDVEIEGSVLGENHPLRYWGWLSLLNSIGALISIAKTASKKIGPLICSMKFLSAEVALYFYKSTIQPGMECCHVWAGAPRLLGIVR